MKLIFYSKLTFFVFSATVGCYIFGMGLAFSSPVGKELTSNATLTDSIHFDDKQNGLFVSIFSIGALVGSPIGGLIMNRIGRRATMLISSILTLVAWSIIGKVFYLPQKCFLIV